MVITECILQVSGKIFWPYQFQPKLDWGCWLCLSTYSSSQSPELDGINMNHVRWNWEITEISQRKKKNVEDPQTHFRRVSQVIRWILRRFRYSEALPLKKWWSFLKYCDIYDHGIRVIIVGVISAQCTELKWKVWPKVISHHSIWDLFPKIRDILSCCSNRIAHTVGIHIRQRSLWG
jgi:hypothetical protein